MGEEIKAGWYVNIENLIFSYILLFVISGCVVFNICGYFKLTARFNEFKYNQKIENKDIFEISAFSDKEKGYRGKMDLREGDVSVSQDVWDKGILGIGEWIIIEGQKYHIASKMAKYKQGTNIPRLKTIDIYKKDVKSAKQFGRKRARVFLIVN